MVLINFFLLVLSMIRWRRLNECSEKKMKEIDVWESIEEGVELDLDHVVTVDLDHAHLVVDRHSGLVLADHAVRHRSEDRRDHRYHSDLVVVLLNVDREAEVSLLAGIFIFIFVILI